MLVANEVAGKRFRCPGCREIIEAPPETTGVSTTERSTAVIRTEAKKNSAPPKRPSEDSLAADSAGRRRRNTQETRETKQDDATSQIWSVSSYDYAEVREPKKEKRRTPNLRARHPEAFAEFDRVVTECMQFLVGLGMVVAALFSLLYFTDNAPSDPERARNIYQGTMIFSGACVVTGLLCLTRWRVLLIIVGTISGISAAWLMLIAGLYSKLLLVPALGLALVCTKLITAVQRYPKAM
jgi:hypothetical protein